MQFRTPEALRDATPAAAWEHCPEAIHLIGGEVLIPDPKTYVFWNTGGGEIHSLRWLLADGTWRVVPGPAIAYLDVALVQVSA